MKYLFDLINKDIKMGLHLAPFKHKITTQKVIVVQGLKRGPLSEVIEQLAQNQRKSNNYFHFLF